MRQPLGNENSGHIRGLAVYRGTTVSVSVYPICVRRVIICFIFYYTVMCFEYIYIYIYIYVYDICVRHVHITV